MAVTSFQTLPGDHGRRIDECVSRQLPGLGPNGVRKVFQNRDVKLDGVRVKMDTRVYPGQTVTVYYMENLLQSRPVLNVVYEDADVLLINKAAGISVEGDDGGGVSLTSLAAQYAGHPVFPCHRLDNQTCGLILFAHHESALHVLEDVFFRRSLDKRYVCLVRGTPKPPECTCTAYLRKYPDQARVRVTDREVPGSTRIITAYETLETMEQISRLRVHLITGRTHQIRAHLAALGHPILGDDVYGDRSLNRDMKTQGRLKLCSTELCLDTGGRLPALDGKHFVISPPF